MLHNVVLHAAHIHLLGNRPLCAVLLLSISASPCRHLTLTRMSITAVWITASRAYVTHTRTPRTHANTTYYQWECLNAHPDEPHHHNTSLLTLIGFVRLSPAADRFRADDMLQDSREDCYLSTLHILRTDEHDSRPYYLVVENERGTDRHAIHLNVEGTFTGAEWFSYIYSTFKICVMHAS